MSTKVYEAYRLKDPARFFDVVAQIKRQGRENVKRELREFALRLASSADTNTTEFQDVRRRLGGSEEAARLELACAMLRRGYRDQATSAERNEWDFDVSVAAHECDGEIYLIPYCDMTMAKTLDFLATMPELEDFAYWDNSDRPKRISARSWKRRASVWDRIHQRGWGLRMVAIEICDWENYWQLDPRLDLAREYRARRDASEGAEVAA